jgi:hypothetical protein
MAHRQLRKLAPTVPNLYLDEVSGIFLVRRMVRGSILERSTGSKDYETAVARYHEIMLELDARKVRRKPWTSLIKKASDGGSTREATALKVEISDDGSPLSIGLRNATGELVPLNRKSAIEILAHLVRVLEDNKRWKAAVADVASHQATNAKPQARPSPTLGVDSPEKRALLERIAARLKG